MGCLFLSSVAESSVARFRSALASGKCSSPQPASRLCIPLERNFSLSPAPRRRRRRFPARIFKKSGLLTHPFFFRRQAHDLPQGGQPESFDGGEIPVPRHGSQGYDASHDWLLHNKGQSEANPSHHNLVRTGSFRQDLDPCSMGQETSSASHSPLDQILPIIDRWEAQHEQRGCSHRDLGSEAGGGGVSKRPRLGHVLSIDQAPLSAAAQPQSLVPHPGQPLPGALGSFNLVGQLR